MADLKKIGMAACTFSVALGIGFVMQNGDALASRFGGEEAPDTTAPFSAQPQDAIVGQVPTDGMAPSEPQAIVAQQGSILPTAPTIEIPNPVVEAAVILPESAKIQSVQSAPVQLANLEAETTPEIETSAALTGEVECAPSMIAQASAAASVALSVSAPCHKSTAFVIHHQGMMFTAMTNTAGEAEMIVPALAEVSVMIAAFDDGEGAVATAAVPDFSKFDRAVLQWQGDTAVMLSAYEGDAGFGDDAHIHAGNPGDMGRVDQLQGGYLVRLGDTSAQDPLMAEIYTFPSSAHANVADVMIVAEAEITAQNCGHEMNAQSIQVSPTGATSALDLTMVMPDCDAVGDFLILQNMFEDLTLVSR